MPKGVFGGENTTRLKKYNNDVNFIDWIAMHNLNTSVQE